MAYFAGGFTPLTGNGTVNGQVTVADSSFLTLEARVLLAGDGLETKEFTVEAIVGFTVTLRSAGYAGSAGTDISEYTIASGATLTMVPQFVTPDPSRNTNTTGSISPLGGGVAISALGGSQNTGTVSFINSNGVTFGYNAGGITASIQPGAAAGLGAAQAGSQTMTGGTLAFANSNNVSFGMSGSSQITASVDAINRATADAIYYPKVFSDRPSGFEDKTQCTISWDDTTNTLTLTPIGTCYVWANGTRYAITVPISKQIADIPGVHYIYINDSGSLSETSSFSINLYTRWATVAWVSWNSALHKAIPDAQDERHGCEWPPEIHMQQHLTVGISYQSGLGLSPVVDGDGSLPSHVELVGDSGVLWDEDLRVAIAGHGQSDNITVMWRLGDHWEYDATSPAVVRSTGSGRPAWNEYTGVTWQLTEIPDTHYMAVYVYAFPSITRQWVVITGQQHYATIEQAQVAAMSIPDLGALPGPEIKLVGSMVVKGDSTYTNGYKAALVPVDVNGGAYIDFRRIGMSGKATAAVVPSIALQANGSTFVSGTATFGNANGMSFAVSNGSIVGSYTVPTIPGATVFSNSNNVTFGLAGSTVTASASYPAQSVQPVAYAAGGTTNNFSTIGFVNSNGVSWSTGTGGVIATVKTDYLTTAANSTHSHGNPTLNLTNIAGTTASASNGFTLSLSATAQSVQPVAYAAGGTTNNFSTLGFVNSNGVSWSTGTGGVIGTVKTDYQSSNANYLTSQSNQAASAGNGNFTFQTLSFADSNGVSFSTGTQGLYATVQTNYALGTHSHGTPTLALTNLTGTTASNSNGFTLSLSANAPGAGAFSAGGSTNAVGTTGLVGAQIAFFPGANITLSESINGGSASLSIIGGAGAGGGVAVAASNSTQTSGTVVLANSNGVSWSSGTQGIFATVKTDYQSSNANYLTVQSAQPVAYAAGGTTNNFSTLGFVNSNGVSWSTGTGGVIATVATNYQSQGAYLTTARASNDGIGLNTAGTNVTWTVNSSGISLNAGAYLTTAANSTHSHGNPTLNLTNIAGTTASASNGFTLSLSATAQSVQPVAYAAGGTTNNFSTIGFVDSNGVSWSTGTGGVIATVKTDYLTTAANSTHSHGNPTLNLTNIAGTTASASNGFTLSLSATAQSVQPVAYAAGGTTNNFSTIGFVNSNGVSWSTGTGGVIATVATNYQSQGAYLTTARASNDGIGLNTAGTNVTWTVNSSGISFNGSAYGNSTHTHGNPTLNLTNIAGTTASASNGLTLSLSGAPAFSAGNSTNGVGTTGLVGSQLVFYPGANMTLSQSINGGSASLSFYGAAAAAGVAIADGAGVTRTSGTVQFGNSNGISFGMDTNGLVTATVNPGAAAGIAAFAASNSTQTSGTVVLANSNGVSWSSGTQGIFATVATNYQSQGAYLTTARASNDGVGLNTAGTNVTWTVNSSGISFNGSAYGNSTHTHGNPTLNLTNIAGTTASASNGFTLSLSATAQSVQPVAYAVGGTTNNFSTLQFSNANGVTWSTSAGSVVVGSVKTDYQSSNANYVTGHTGPVGVIVNASASTLSGGNLGFSNSNGVSWGWNGSTITASVSQTQQPMYFSAGTTSSNANTLQFGTSAANGNVTFAISGGSIVGSAPTAGGGNFSAGNSTDGVGTTGLVGSQLAFFPGNNVTLSQSINGASASLSIIAGGAGVAIKGSGTYTQSTGTVEFANSNNITFGLSSNGTMTASFSQTVQPVAAQGSNGSYLFSTLSFSNANGMSFGTSAGSAITGSYTVPGHTGPVGILVNASASTLTNGTLGFSNSNGVSWGWNGSTLTATVATAYLPLANSNNYFYTSNNTFANSTHTHGGLTLNLTGINASSTSASNGLTLNLSAAGGGGVAISAGSNGGTAATSQSTGTVVFSNSNGVTFGLSNNGVMTASVQAGAAAGIGGVGIGASTQTNGTLVFANTGNVTFGFNGSTITASAPSGGGGYTALTFQNRQLGASSNTVPGLNSVWLVPMRVANAVSASTLLQMISITGSVTSNQTNTINATLDVMLYKVTGTNQSRFDSVWSAQGLFTFWNGGTTSMSAAYAHQGTTDQTNVGASSANFMASFFGLRLLTFTIGSELGTGLYAYGFRQSSASTNQSSLMRSFNIVIDNPMPLGANYWGASTTQLIGYVDGGLYASAATQTNNFTSNAMPDSFEFSNIKQTNNAVPYVKIGAV